MKSVPHWRSRDLHIARQTRLARGPAGQKRLTDVERARERRRGRDRVQSIYMEMGPPWLVSRVSFAGSLGGCRSVGAIIAIIVARRIVRPLGGEASAARRPSTLHMEQAVA